MINFFKILGLFLDYLLNENEFMSSRSIEEVSLFVFLETKKSQKLCNWSVTDNYSLYHSIAFLQCTKFNLIRIWNDVVYDLVQSLKDIANFFHLMFVLIFQRVLKLVDILNHSKLIHSCLYLVFVILCFTIAWKLLIWFCLNFSDWSLQA